MRLVAALLIPVALGGCGALLSDIRSVANTVTQSPADVEAQSFNLAMSQAQAGQRSFSSVFRERYARASNLHPSVQLKPFYMQSANIMIDVATAFEAGQISRERFDSIYRDMQAAEAQAVQAVRAQQQAAFSQAVANWNATMQATQQRVITCTTTQTGTMLTTQCR